MNSKTLCVHGTHPDPVTGAITVPIYQSATFRHTELYTSTGYDYTRTDNPTRHAVEDVVALLEEGCVCCAFSSGMAAIGALLRTLPPHGHIIVSSDLYGGTYRLLEEIYRHTGLACSYVDTGSAEVVEDAWREDTVALYIESPTNPMMNVSDIPELARMAHQRGAVCFVDNTFLTPYFQKPLSLGADAVIHSGTKYLSGHNDTLAGFVITKNGKLGERVRFIQNTEGAVLSPFDSWLVLRGIKTLALRMEQHQKNAMQIASFLQEQPWVDRVLYPGLPEHPRYKILSRQAGGFGGMISFYVADETLVPRILKNIRIIAFAESLGGVETLITYPAVQTHSAIPKEVREASGINMRLLRLSVGIEDADDLIRDLSQAVEA